MKPIILCAVLLTLVGCSSCDHDKRHDSPTETEQLYKHCRDRNTCDQSIADHRKHRVA
ncbi:hypothetical protein KFZ67_15295 [Photobacterium damselae]|uniref:hypothetical protein n=1 Tax=Photobacterium damselae TaxID=38293 RepID=UPI002543C8AF